LLVAHTFRARYLLCFHLQNLSHLTKLSPANAATITAVQQAILAVSLDDWTYPHPPSTSPSTPAPTTPSITEIDAHLHNTRSSYRARNRWFDKPFTLIVESNARAGVTGEHSPVDALVPSIVAEYALVQAVDGDAFPSAVPPPLRDAVVEGVQGWRMLEWVTDEKIENECATAEERAAKVIDDSDDSVLWFEEYGSEWVKDVGGCALWCTYPRDG
jgi:hypothetical protein